MDKDDFLKMFIEGPWSDLAEGLELLNKNIHKTHAIRMIYDPESETMNFELKSIEALLGCEELNKKIEKQLDSNISLEKLDQNIDEGIQKFYKGDPLQDQSVLDMFVIFLRELYENKLISRTDLPKFVELHNAISILITRNSIRSHINSRDLQKKHQAQRGAKAKLAKDPRQAAKSFVLECWNKWQKNPDNYKSKAAFARDMLTKQESLTSQKKIEDWCREWEK